MSWNAEYLARTKRPAQDPVYCLVICEDRTQLGADLGLAPTTINGAPGDTMTLRDGGEAVPVMVYDSEAFELYRGIYDPATNDFAVTESAAYGTTDRAFLRMRSNIAVPWLSYSTSPVNELFETGMSFPSGGGQEFDLIEGHTSVDPVAISVQDTNGRITREMKGRTAIGKWGIVFGGYRGLPFAKFVMLHAGPVTRMRIMQGSVYEFEVDTVMVKLKRKLFADVAAFSTTLSSSMNSTQETIPLTDTSGCYAGYPNNAGTRPNYVGGGAGDNTYWWVGMHYKVGNEYMLQATSSLSPVNVRRGRLDSTAASHSSGASVDLVFLVEGHPINMLLGFMLTRDPGYDPLGFLMPDEPGANYYDWLGLSDPNKGPLGLHIEVGDVDVESFEQVRDEWFPRYYGRLAFSKETDMEKELRESILKPLGLSLYVNRAGKISLSVLRPPLSSTAPIMDEGDVVGVPDIEFTNEEIVNEVRVEYDHDFISNDSNTSVTVLDATSQSTYDRAGDLTMEVRWLRENLRGPILAPRISRKKMRHHREPNPTFSLAVLFTAIAADISDVVQVSMPRFPDPQGGKIGFNKLVLVVGRHPDWEQGALMLDVIDTAYLGRRYGLIAPSGMADYPDAQEIDRENYVFIADGTTHLMSDGTIAYQII